MQIWPWSKISALTLERDLWLERWSELYQTQLMTARYLDSVTGNKHTFLNNRLYVFKEDGVCEVVEADNEVPYAPV
jgi:hypothetical protein